MMGIKSEKCFPRILLTIWTSLAVKGRNINSVKPNIARKNIPLKIYSTRFVGRPSRLLER